MKNTVNNPFDDIKLKNQNILITSLDLNLYRCSYMDAETNPNNNVTPQMSFLIGKGSIFKEKYGLASESNKLQLNNDDYYLADELNIINPILDELSNSTNNDQYTFNNWFHELVRLNQRRMTKNVYRALYNDFEVLDNQNIYNTPFVKLSKKNHKANEYFFNMFFEEYLHFIDNFNLFDTNHQTEIYKTYKDELSHLLVCKPLTTERRYFYGNSPVYISDVIKKQSHYKFRTMNENWFENLININKKIRFNADPRPDLTNLNAYLMGTNTKSWHYCAEYVNMPLNKEIYSQFRYVSDDFRDDLLHFAINIKRNGTVRAMFLVVINHDGHFELHTNNLMIGDYEFMKIRRKIKASISFAFHKMQKQNISI